MEQEEERDWWGISGGGKKKEKLKGMEKKVWMNEFCGGENKRKRGSGETNFMNQNM